MNVSDFSSFVRPLPHPGEHLREDILPEYGLTARTLAEAMGLKHEGRIEQIIQETMPISPDIALRLAKVFSTSVDFWMDLQIHHDLSKAAILARHELAAIRPLNAA